MEPRAGRERESGTSTWTGGTRRLRGAWGSSDNAASRAVWSQPLKGRKLWSLKLQGFTSNGGYGYERRGKPQYALEVTRVYI